MIISTDSEKAFHKIQHSFLIITLSKLERKGNFLNLIESIYKKPTANLIFNGERLNTFPLRADVCSHHFHSALHRRAEPVPSGKKKK